VVRERLSIPLTHSCLRRWSGCVGSELEAERMERWTHKTKAFLMYMLGVSQLRQAKRQEIMPFLRANHHQSHSLRCFAEVTGWSHAELPHGSPKD